MNTSDSDPVDRVDRATRRPANSTFVDPIADDDGSEDLALADAQKQLVRNRLVRAARRACAQRGIDVRMEDVALEAGVSRRTAFRYFPNRSELIREAFVSGMHNYRARVAGTATDRDPKEWLDAVCLATHKLNAGVGKLYWDLTFSAIDDPELARTIDVHHASRKEFIGSVANTAWQAYGGSVTPPAWLVDAIAVQLSAFTTEALRSGYERTPEQIGAETSDVIHRLITAALSEKR